MANHISAIKRHRQSENRQTFNRWWKSRVRASAKEVLDAVQTGDKGKAAELLNVAQREIDKAATKGVFHKKTASRKVARLSRQVSQIN